MNLAAKQMTTGLLCLLFVGAASSAALFGAERRASRASVKVYTNADLPERPRVSVIGPRDGSDPYEGMRMPAEAAPEKIIVVQQVPGGSSASQWSEDPDPPEPRSGNRATRGRSYRLPGYYPYLGIGGFYTSYNRAPHSYNRAPHARDRSPHDRGESPHANRSPYNRPSHHTPTAKHGSSHRVQGH